MDFNTLVPVYDTLYDDQRGLDQFNNDMPYPATSVVARIQSGQPVRVAGLLSPGEDAPAQVRIIDALNRAMIEEMARRWNATLDYVPNSALNAVDLVANGQADIAVGASARWDGADRVDYSLPYIQHGDRLMIPAGSGLSGFSDMLGSGWIIGYFADDAADAEHIQKFADYFNVGQNVRTFAIQRENEAIYIMITESNIKAIFGDSLRLLALTKEGDSGSSVKILNTWYGDVLPITFAVPRNDADFQEMVDHTLQDMARDGTYSNLWAAFFGLGDPLKIPFWPDISPDVP
jgi:ABC-type amino acid transport substrate-binding protein